MFVFEDDFPLNGEHDAGGGIDMLSPNEPGLGGFQITLFDDAGGTGDATGQPTYDMFNMPLTNSLAGTIDPVTGAWTRVRSRRRSRSDQAVATPTMQRRPTEACQKGIVGMIVTCPKYESDGTTLSPLAGQAIVNNLLPGRYGVVATPGADRIARGEEWLQTNTLDGQKAHDSFMRIGEPAYFQEFGPAGYHVTIGFANPAIINAAWRTFALAAGTCSNEVKGHVTTARMSRPPDERLYGSGSRDSFAFTQCYASLGDPDGADFAFAKCDADGNFDFTGIPAGQLEDSPSSTSGTIRSWTASRLPSDWPADQRYGSWIWEKLRFTSGRRTSTPAPSSTTTATACRYAMRRERPSPALRWCRPTSASATAASPTSTAPT